MDRLGLRHLRLSQATANATSNSTNNIRGIFLRLVFGRTAGNLFEIQVRVGPKTTGFGEASG